MEIKPEIMLSILMGALAGAAIWERRLLKRIKGNALDGETAEVESVDEYITAGKIYTAIYEKQKGSLGDLTEMFQVSTSDDSSTQPSPPEDPTSSLYL